MSVIAELQVAPEAFELGRILELHGAGSVELETMVPLGQRTVPFIRVHDIVRQEFEENVATHPSVEHIREVERHDDESLYSLDWNTATDHFFSALEETGAQLLNARGTADKWDLEIWFPSHDRLGTFHSVCERVHISLTVVRIYNPSKPGIGPWFGLSTEQRETLMRAVEGGYYAIPRRLSTLDLAEEFDISDQAVTERLRRAITTLVEHTLLLPNPDTEERPTGDD